MQGERPCRLEKEGRHKGSSFWQKVKAPDRGSGENDNFEGGGKYTSANHQRPWNVHFVYCLWVAIDCVAEVKQQDGKEDVCVGIKKKIQNR